MESSDSDKKTAADWPSLSVVQQWFQCVVTHPDGVDAGIESSKALDCIPISRDDLEKLVTRSEKVSAKDRISIYGNAYYARLIECLGDFYPVLKRALGDEAFNGFAFDYLQRYPSRTYTLDQLGKHLPEFLEETRPDEAVDGTHSVGWPDFLIDLARLEWTIAAVFDGPGIEKKSTLQMTQLQGLSASQWENLHLQLVPCLKLLSTKCPVNDFYSLNRMPDEEVNFESIVPQETYLAITRVDYVVRRYPLSKPEYELLRLIKSGATLGEAIEKISMTVDNDDAALATELQGWFHSWTTRMFFECI